MVVMIFVSWMCLLLIIQGFEKVSIVGDGVLYVFVVELKRMIVYLLDVVQVMLRVTIVMSM